MARYAQYNPYQYQSTFVPQNVEGYAKILGELQAKQEAAETALAARQDEIMGLKYWDEAGRTAALENMKAETDKLYKETRGDYGTNLGKVQNTISNIKQHPFFNLNQKQLEEVEWAKKYELEHGTNALIYNDPRRKSLVNEKGEWVNPGDLEFKAINREDHIKALEKASEKLKQHSRTVVGKSFTDEDTGYKIMPYTDISELTEEDVRAWVFGKEGRHAAELTLATMPKLKEYLIANGITDPEAQTQYMMEENFNIQRQKIGKDSQTRWESLGKVAGWGEGNNTTNPNMSDKPYSKGPIEVQQNADLINKVRKESIDFNSMSQEGKEYYKLKNLEALAKSGDKKALEQLKNEVTNWNKQTLFVPPSVRKVKRKVGDDYQEFEEKIPGKTIKRDMLKLNDDGTVSFANVDQGKSIKSEYEKASANSEDWIELRTKYPILWNKYKDDPQKFLDIAEGVNSKKATKQIIGYTIKAGDPNSGLFFENVNQDFRANIATVKAIDKETQEPTKIVSSDVREDIEKQLKAQEASITIIPEKGQLRLVSKEGEEYTFNSDEETQSILNTAKDFNSKYEDESRLGTDKYGRDHYQLPDGSKLSIAHNSRDVEENKKIIHTFPSGQTFDLTIEEANELFKITAFQSITSSKKAKK